MPGQWPDTGHTSTSHAFFECWKQSLHGSCTEVGEVPADSPDVVIGDAARRLADVLHGPYSGLATAEAAVLASEAVRYLNYAAIRGGSSDGQR